MLAEEVLSFRHVHVVFQGAMEGLGGACAMGEQPMLLRWLCQATIPCGRCDQPVNVRTRS